MENKTKQLLVGVAKENITPVLGTELYGYPLPLRCAERVMDPLMVGAVALRQGEETILLICADSCSFSVEFSNEVRRMVCDAVGVRVENICFSAIHTHSGPITKGSTGWGSANLDYLDNMVAPQAVKAAQKAIEALQPAVMGLGFSETMTGINRREIDKDGNVILGQNPDGPYDPTMTLVCFKTHSGEYIGSIVHFAAHPTAAARNKAFTRDWPGLLVDRVEELTHAPCVYFNGAEGDVGPRLSNGKTTGGEEYVIEAGKIVAADIEKAFRSILGYTTPELKVAYKDILLPFVTPPSEEAVEAEIAQFEANPETIEGVRASRYDQLNRVKAIYDSGKELPHGCEIAQTVIALGDLAIVPAPFEAFCKISLDIKERSPYPHTVLFGLTNGTLGYLPTKDQIPFGGYEVDSFKAIGAISMVEDTDQHFIYQNLATLHELINKK